MRLTLPQQKYPTGEAIDGVLRGADAPRRRRVPGVTAAAMASQFPPSGFFSSQVEVEGAAAAGTTLPTANTTIASRGYFEALRIPLAARTAVQRRPTLPADPRRVVVNQAFVARYLAGRDPIGARVRTVGRGGPGPWTEIIGVVGDARNNGAGRRRPARGLHRDGAGTRRLEPAVPRRPLAAGCLGAHLPAVRAAVASIDPEQPVYAIQTLEEARGGVLVPAADLRHAAWHLRRAWRWCWRRSASTA